MASEVGTIPSADLAIEADTPLGLLSSSDAIPSASNSVETYSPSTSATSTAMTVATNASETAEVFVILITINHSSLANPIRVSSDTTEDLPVAGQKGTISNGEEFIYLPFEFILPNMEADSPPRAQLKIDNISREISTAIDSIDSAPDVDIELVLASNPDVIEFALYDFKLRRVEYDIFEARGDVTAEHFEDEPYPAGSFNPSGFTGLFQS